MKDFNLELAKAGHPVITRDGREVKIIYFNKGGGYPLIGIVDDDEIKTFTNEGKFRESVNSDSDLFMATVKKQGWINLYVNNNNSNYAGSVYKTEEGAKGNCTPATVATIPIEWEE